MSGHLWSMQTNSELQRVCWRCCDEAAGSPMNISTRGSMALWCCFGRLFASLSTWLASQRCAQRTRPTTAQLPPRPSRRNNGIGPEGATSLAGPLAIHTKLQWLELRYGPLAACGGVALGGREAGRRGHADGLGAREGGRDYSPLSHVHSSALPPADRLFPHSPASYPRSRRNTLDSGSASALAASLARLGGLPYLNRVGPGGVARSAGRPVVPEPQRRTASHCEQVYFDY
jgi:hypothetical protein